MGGDPGGNLGSLGRKQEGRGDNKAAEKTGRSDNRSRAHTTVSEYHNQIGGYETRGERKPGAGREPGRVWRSEMEDDMGKAQTTPRVCQLLDRPFLWLGASRCDDRSYW